MKTITLDDIRSWRPCYDPAKHLPEDWTGAAIDILKLENVPVSDRLWVVLRTELVSERTMRLFAVWCARQVQHLMTDPRSLNALDVAERFANGAATEAEREAAWTAAREAAWAAEAAWDAEAGSEAAWAAAWAAKEAAWAAWDAGAAGDAQIAKLIEMIQAEEKQQ